MLAAEATSAPAIAVWTDACFQIAKAKDRNAHTGIRLLRHVDSGHAGSLSSSSLHLIKILSRMTIANLIQRLNLQLELASHAEQRSILDGNPHLRT